jgi:uncharacterized protein YbbC (DUF1343 family)
MIKRFILLGLCAVALMACLGLNPAFGEAVRTGLDVLVAEDFASLAGKSVGVITNHTGVDSRGRHIIDLLHETPKVKLEAIFGPEHGYRGEAAAGVQMVDGRDEKTGVQVYSLYGKNKKPTAEMVADLDVLIFDIQDVGARFYTYIWTMAYGLEAAAEFDKEFYVLDRPNPITGLHVFGPVNDETARSFVGLYPIATHHGMTVGELATMFNQEKMSANGVQARLRVIKMKNWTRDMWYDQTGLEWIPTSPNIPSLDAATVYTGTCIFEATNVSEGRGTDTPFLNIGAPWIVPADWIAELDKAGLAGISFEPAAFTTRQIPGKTRRPRYEGEESHGVHLVVTDRDSFNPVVTGLHMVTTLKKLYMDELKFREGSFTRLFGRNDYFMAVDNGMAPSELVLDWQADLEKFKEMRAKHLLY